VDSERYDGKPLLRLLELYVLWATDTLSDEDEERLFALAPSLAESFGGDGSWQSALATAMHFPADMPRMINESWVKNVALAAGSELAPQQFAEKFVDAHFAG
jgi:hypothetical protein